MKRSDCFLKILCRRTALYILVCCYTINCFSQDNITLSYVGNMGVLIGDDEQAVLVDGFHKEYGPQYLFPSDSLVKRIIDGKYAGFGTIDIAIGTHQHKDHFDPAYFHDFLESNKSSIAILSPQVKEVLNTEPENQKPDWHDQIKTSEYDAESHTFHHGNIKVTAFQCDHVNAQRHKSIENTAYIITIKDLSILHVGDSNWDVAEKHLIAHQELLKHLDVAILPYWMLLEEKSIGHFEQLINSMTIVATHIPTDFGENQKKTISENFKNVLFFTKIGQSIPIFDIR